MKIQKKHREQTGIPPMGFEKWQPFVKDFEGLSQGRVDVFHLHQDYLFSVQEMARAGITNVWNPMDEL